MGHVSYEAWDVTTVPAACGPARARTAAQAKRKRQAVGGVKVVVAGCVAQQEGQQLLRRVPEVDVVMGEARTWCCGRLT